MKSKAEESKAMSSLFFVLADIANAILFKSSKEEFNEVRKMFISILGTILVKKEAPNYTTTFENLELLRIRSELIELLGKS